MARKRAALNSAAAPTDQLPDFSKVDPVMSLPKVSHRKIDEDGLDHAHRQALRRLQRLPGGAELRVSSSRSSTGSPSW